MGRPPRGILVQGRSGLLLVEPELGRITRLTDQLYTPTHYARCFVARRDGDAVTVWTTDRGQYQLTIQNVQPA